MGAIRVFSHVDMALRAFCRLTEVFGLRDIITEIDPGNTTTIRSLGGERDYLEVGFVFRHYSGPTDIITKLAVCGENAGCQWGPRINTYGRWRRTLRAWYPNGPEGEVVFVPPEGAGDYEFFTESLTGKEARCFDAVLLPRFRS